MTTRASKLAGWTKLDERDFERIYDTVKPYGEGLTWHEIVVLSPANTILHACKEAEKDDFLNRLAIGVANWECKANRSDQEIADMLIEVSTVGVLQGMTDQPKGFMNTQILLPLHLISLACATVYRQTSNRQKMVGTAFLVGPDLVLTAAHVALECKMTNGAGVWSNDIWPDLFFDFMPNPRDPNSAGMRVKPAHNNSLVCHAPPHATPPNALKVSTAPPAARNLDYALIRLAQQINHIEPVPLIECQFRRKSRPVFRSKCSPLTVAVGQASKPP